MEIRGATTEKTYPLRPFLMASQQSNVRVVVKQCNDTI